MNEPRKKSERKRKRQACGKIFALALTLITFPWVLIRIAFFPRSLALSTSIKLLII